MFADKNTAQEKLVYKTCLKLKTFSASKIYRHYPIANTPITSIRRSLHTLNYKLNLIVQTGKKVKSMLGRPELEYKLIDDIFNTN